MSSADSRRSLVNIHKMEKKGLYWFSYRPCWASTLDINKVVDDFEEIREIFDGITSKVAQSDMKGENTDVKTLRKSVKGALRNLQGITTHQHLKKIDGGFRSELAETTETMLNFLQDSSDPAKVEAMELQMLNVIDNIDNGTTETVFS